MANGDNTTSRLKSESHAYFLPVSIFQPTDQPDQALENDNLGGIEVGVKIRATQNGTISGIRYYRGTGTTGLHVGSIWTISGTKLADVTFDAIQSTDPSDWEEASFSTPLSIEAGVTYIASVYSPSGDYASTSNYFTTATVNGPIKALADGEDGGNGLYKYGSSGVPTSSHNKSNYWVDVVFNAGEGGGSGTVNGTTNYLAKFTVPNTVGNSILFDNGSSIGIGTTVMNGNYKLFVESGIRTRKVKVDIDSWADYVFEADYRLASLKDVEDFIKKNKHLPGVPSAREVEKEGLNLGDNQAVLLKKIEELTLYLIEQNKEKDQIKARIKELEERIMTISGKEEK